MGIPSYFSYIIKNYPNIISSISKLYNDGIVIDNLFMDCNSIVYDIFNNFSDEEKGFSNIMIENILIERVICKIEEYILLLNPLNTVFIAFDGVAPFAKMEQQRTRRFKSAHMEQVILPKMGLNNSNKVSCRWKTYNITPGTPFMRKLSCRINTYFANVEYKTKKVIVSASDVRGEGEHKMFEYLRKVHNINENVFVYGLDSDLIMLSIFHRELTKNIYVFREAPEFSKSHLEIKEKSNELLFMDIGLLSCGILREMNTTIKEVLGDYIVLCFFLGNDFLPHMASLNIRKGGIDILLQCYRKVVGNGNGEGERLIKNGEINWNTMKKLIKELAKREHENLIQEEILRDRMEKYKFKDEEELIKNIPVLFRSVEKYISVREEKWEERYYKALFNSKRNKCGEEISKKYLEGIKWVYKYYTKGCVNWKWSYEYNSALLLVDVERVCNGKEMELEMEIEMEGYNEEEQMMYVMPPGSEEEMEINEDLKRRLKERKEKIEEMEYEWSYKRYMWESEIK